VWNKTSVGEQGTGQGARVGGLDATHSSSIFTNVTAEYIKRSITRHNGTVSVAGLR